MGQIIWIVGMLVGIVVLVLGGYLVWLSVVTRAHRPEEDGFEYVFVNDDGSVREVTEVERRRLTSEYPENDSRCPYIKLRYESRDDQGRRRGFLRRRQLPVGVRIEAAD